MKHVKDKLKASTPLKNVYDEIYKIAKDFTKKKGGTFVLRPYQVLVAATVVAKK